MVLDAHSRLSRGNGEIMQGVTNGIKLSVRALVH
jgi:hypothetical protein